MTIAGDYPMTVQFTDISTGGPFDTYAWTFGDGGTSALQNPVYTYTVPGTYTVSLTATIAGIPTTFTRVGYILCYGPRPPCFAYDNLLRNTGGTVTVSTENASFLKENAYDWNPSTFWKPTAVGVSWLRVHFAAPQPCNYLAVYAHNIGTNGGTCKLQSSDDNGATWQDVSVVVTPATTEVIYIHFATVSHADYRFWMSTPAVISAIGVVSFGVDFALEHGDWIGFAPPPLARNPIITNNVSDRGTLLGRSVISQGSTFSMKPAFMSPAFAYGTWKAFMIHAEQRPFFVDWARDDYPTDVAFAWTQGKLGSPMFSQRALLDAAIAGACRVS